MRRMPVGGWGRCKGARTSIGQRVVELGVIGIGVVPRLSDADGDGNDNYDDDDGDDGCPDSLAPVPSVPPRLGGLGRAEATGVAGVAVEALAEELVRRGVAVGLWFVLLHGGGTNEGIRARGSGRGGEGRGNECKGRKERK